MLKFLIEIIVQTFDDMLFSALLFRFDRFRLIIHWLNGLILRLSTSGKSPRGVSVFRGRGGLNKFN